MSGPHPFEQILDQIADLIAKTRNPRPDTFTPGLLPKEIDRQIDQFEADVLLFKMITDEAAKLTGIDEEGLKQSARHPPEGLAAREKHLLERAAKLHTELEKLSAEIGMQSRQVKLEQKNAKASGKKRKKKFKRLGGQGWMPL